MKSIKYGYLFLLLLVPVFLISQSNQWITPNSGWNKIGNNVSLINGSDNVGIGTTTPDSTFEVNGAAVINGSFNFGHDTGGDDTYAVTVSGVTNYHLGLIIILSVDTDNTGACTLNISGLGAKSIKTQTGADPVDSYLDSNSTVMFIFDGTNFVLQTPDANP